MAYSGQNSGMVIYDGAQTFKGTNGIEVKNWKDFLIKE